MTARSVELVLHKTDMDVGEAHASVEMMESSLNDSDLSSEMASQTYVSGSAHGQPSLRKSSCHGTVPAEAYREPLLDSTPPQCNIQTEYEMRRSRLQGINPLHRLLMTALQCFTGTIHMIVTSSSMARVTMWSWLGGANDGNVQRRIQKMRQSDADLGGGGDDVDDEDDDCSEQGPLLGDIEESERTDYDLMVDVDVECEPDAVLKTSPRILSSSMMQDLAEHGLPQSVGLKRWVRIYSVTRDGDSFGTFLHHVRDKKDTIVVLKTMENEIFGGYVDTAWERCGNIDRAAFYGTGQSFLFSFGLDQRGSDNDVMSEKSPFAVKPVQIYKWTGKNNYNQLCDVEHSMLAMGGGGLDANFGLCIQDCFSKGSTGTCDTYGNEPLAKQEFFEILAMEVYGFVNAW